MKTKMKDGTGARDYRFVSEDVDRHGNVRLYFRRAGAAKIRLHEMPGTPAFDAEYMRAFRGETAPEMKGNKRAPTSPGTMRWLCQEYYKSAVFQGLGDSTKKVRRSLLDSICERAGTFPYSTIEARNVAKLRDEKAEFPEAANARVKALRQLFAWASAPEYAYTSRNPAREVPYLKSNNPDGFRAWTEDDVAKFEKRHAVGTKARLALDLMLYTGVRRSDVVKLGPQMERDGKLVFTETKGRAKIVKTHELPILEPLRRSIDATPTGHLVYLVTAFGRPHSVKAFGNWFKRRCREAGVAADLSAHGLRKLGAQRCAEAGASEHQIMALFGWASTKQAAIYTRKASRAKLEAEAAPMLTGQNSNRSSHLFPVVASSGTNGGKTP
jgi:integrase